MPGQLDILALEPFYGGMRRTMLESSFSRYCTGAGVTMIPSLKAAR